jgi:DNA-binding NarL/FixJ family response regulator
LNGLDAARKIHEAFPQTETFILTMHDAAGLIAELPGSGVRACVLKTEVEILIDEVRRTVGAVCDRPRS